MDSVQDGADESAQYVIVGAGITGAAIAAHLAARGAHPLILEAGEPGRGPTAASGGMVRGYDPDPVTALLAAASLATYADPAVWCDGVAPLHRVGAVTLAAADEAEQLHRAAKDLHAASFADAHVLGGGTFEEACGVRTDGAAALVEPAGGYVEPGRVTELFLRQAVRDGARLIAGFRVEALRRVDGGILLEGARRTVRATRTVVLALGGWAARPPNGVQPVGARVRTRSIQVSVVRRPAGTPPHATFVDLRDGCYGRPLDEDHCLVGLPLPVWDENPDSESPPDLQHHRRTLRAVRRNLPWVEDTGAVRIVRSFDGYCDDDRLLISTGLPGVWLARAGSGGGVKVAPELGRRIAERLLSDSADGPRVPGIPERRGGTDAIAVL